VRRAVEPLEAARSLAPRIRELAPAIERDRQLPRELVDAIRDAGLFHMLLPRDLGGAETDPVTAARVVEEVAAADGATGWCVMIAQQGLSFAGYLTADAAREIWGGGGIVAGTARPIGRAIPTSDPAPGFTVSGRWPFASGSSHADWLCGECVVYDGDEPRRDANGGTLSRMVFIPREQATIHDTWHTTGLRGTASNDFSVAGVFVPEERGFFILADEPRHPWALYQALPLLFINHGSHALGVARAAIETAAELAKSKTAWGTDRPMSEQPRFQGPLAEATAFVESARTYLYAVSQEYWDAVLAGVEDTARLRARVRLATSHAGRSSVRAVDLVHAAVGTSSVFTTTPLERQFRDIHTAAAHVMISQLTFEAAGRVQLGLDPAFPFF
jgi:alkylation response protein AidB-like acyl-CoA dehydrogenase